MEAYDLYSQFNPDISNESSEDRYPEGNLLSVKGVGIMSENIGSTHVYDKFFRKTFGSEVEWEDFNDVINFVLTMIENTFRNLILTINGEGQVFRRISLTKKLILITYMKGLDLALSPLHVNRYSEVYEEYASCEQT